MPKVLASSSRSSGIKAALSCPTCDYVALSSDSLAVHRALKHMFKSYFYCCECNESFEEKAEVIQHIICEHLSVLMDNNEGGGDGVSDSSGNRRRQKRRRQESEYEAAYEDDGDEMGFGGEENNYDDDDFDAPAVQWSEGDDPISVKARLDQVSNGMDLRNELGFGTSQNGRFVCFICGKKVRSKHNYIVHVNETHYDGELFRCAHCSQNFQRLKGMQKHVRTAHPGKDEADNFVCSHCGKLMSAKGVLKRHIMDAHMKIKRHQCPYCVYSATQKSSLQTHLKAKHKHEVKQEQEEEEGEEYYAEEEEEDAIAESGAVHHFLESSDML